jgi:hypothetical protein
MNNSNLNSINRNSRNRNTRLNNRTNNVLNTIDTAFQNITSLQNTIDSVVQEYANISQNRNISSNVRTRTNMRQNTQTQNNSNDSGYVEYMSFLHALRDVMIGYNNNIREYNNNINSFLQILSSVQEDLSVNRNHNIRERQTNNNQNEEPVSESIPSNNSNNEEETLPIQNEENQQHVNNETIPEINQTTNSNRYNSQSLDSIIYDMLSSMDLPNVTLRNPDSSFNNVTGNISNNIRRNINRPRENNRRTLSETISYYTTFIPTNAYTNLRDVVIRPSVEQITNATEEINFSTNHSRYTFTNTTCPITLEEFQEGEILRRINHCGHVFRESAIQNWFRQNVRCPVCRYDIRDYIQPQSNDFSVNSELDDLQQQEIDTEVELERTRTNYDTETQRQSDISMNNYMLNENQTPIDSFHDATNEIFNEITNEFSNLINQYLTNNNDNYNSDLIYSIEFEPIYADVFDISLDRTID